jgi:selenocysteine lyase/cysteine desulfurase
MLSFFEELRRREFARLDGHAYLDYTGSALYAASQIRAHQEILERGVFGNPHSDSAPSLASTEVIEHARELVLDFLDVDASTHEVIFTANTTAAIKLVAESYPFGPDAGLVLSMDNHNSVNGIREYARRAGAPVRVLPLDEELRLDASELDAGPGLLAFPAQSNFSGVRHPLSLVAHAHSLGYDVLLDIAAYAPSRAISLRECPADFAALSFYKLFGYPTGLGALIARRDALARLRRPWFAGGTVEYASVRADRHRLRAGAEGFEDGTPSFLAIAALAPGFALLDSVGMPRLCGHVSHLTMRFLEQLVSLPRVRVYGPASMRDRGGTIALNIEGVPYSHVEARAREAGVSVRGGCFCNPGASEAAFGLRRETLTECFDAMGDEFTVERFAECAGTAVGAIRVSIGMANDEADIDRAIGVLASFYA